MANDSALRLLVKSYANGLLERNQYLDIRQKLLKRLSSKGEITHKDLQYFMNKYQETEQESIWKNYSISDWIIIILGFMAAATLAIFLYN